VSDNITKKLIIRSLHNILVAALENFNVARPNVLLIFLHPSFQCCILIFEEDQSEAALLTIDLLKHNITLGDTIVSKEFTKLIVCDGERKASQLHDSVNVLLSKILAQLHCATSLLHLLKVKIVVESDLIEFNPSVSDVLALLLPESTLAFLLILEEHCSFSGFCVVLVAPNLY
jgi:hypothetical protein